MIEQRLKLLGQGIKKAVCLGKKDWEKERWEALRLAMNDKDYRTFWAIVSAGDGERGSAIEPNIAPEVWETHFGALYSVRDGDFNTGEFL